MNQQKVIFIIPTVRSAVKNTILQPKVAKRTDDGV